MGGLAAYHWNEAAVVAAVVVEMVVERMPPVAEGESVLGCTASTRGPHRCGDHCVYLVVDSASVLAAVELANDTAQAKPMAAGKAKC